MPEGPAESAGVHVGDVILEVDGTRVDSFGAGPVALFVLERAVGEAARLVVQRGGQSVSLSIVIGKEPESRPRWTL